MAALVLPSHAAARPPCPARLEWIHDEAAWAALAPEWDALLERMARPSPFLRWQWLRTWWARFGNAGALRVVVARGAGRELLAAAPLHLTTRRAFGVWGYRALEFIGYRGSAVCADHFDFLYAAGDESAPAALVAELVRRQCDWDALTLADLAEQSPLPRLLRAASSLSVSAAPAEICYFLPLPSTTAELWSALKNAHPKLAGNVKYYRSRLARDHRLRFSASIEPAAAASTLEALARLHALARGRKYEAGNFHLAPYRAFHEQLIARMAESPRLYLARLECDDITVAVLYGFFESGVLYYYQSGFDTALSAYGLGTLMVAFALEDAITRLGAREFDFLRGAEGYKTRWTRQLRSTQTLRAWTPTAAARLQRLELALRRRAARWRTRLRSGETP